MGVVEDDSSSNPSSQLRKAKTELQDGFQLSYQPAALNQLQDGGDNLIMTATIIIITIQVPFSNMSQQPVEMQKTMQKTKVRCKPRFLVMIMIVKVMVILLMLVMFW